MIPFLKKREAKQVGVIVQDRAPDQKEENQENDKDASIHACAQDLINAVHAKDVAKAAEAIRSAFEILESQPHDEAPHTYAAQNEAAADKE